MPPRTKRTRTEPGEPSAARQILPSFRPSRENRYLFRDYQAYNNFNGNFKNRKCSDCYFFDKSGILLSVLVEEKLMGYINHWNWGTLLSCQEPFTNLLTQVFYANLTFTSEPFKVTSYMCGQEIDLSLENIANWFGLTNAGEESYPLRSWPTLAIDTADHYKNWFDRNNRTGAPLYSSSLPSIHRLVFLLINNILTPKSTIKTNMEHGACYYLRHLLSLDDKVFNFPYIILRHIRNASRSNVYSLPYGNLIHSIFKSLGFVIPTDLERIYPINLVNELTNIGWKDLGIDTATQLPRLVPDNRPINNWIFRPNALPNQYWDPMKKSMPTWTLINIKYSLIHRKDRPVKFLRQCKTK